ncbi:uncharacterized protein B0I36DRAFT_354729 [Microdochium trichocladiopsis]|uniref:Uncharacterized protein n=1 Tax=Microdochium trichocladiopsis TaxID=1682393 RepID=A0A9P9BHG1_9PEZI|nr:uncharacterized protein B0I36DRAFT_354729 [Microdochium trichocladiopsis]KAH7018449.1 hypothetical protein B0I36DRAFT_354729 [Microdochium trichocladiopsis]
MSDQYEGEGEVEYFDPRPSKITWIARVLVLVSTAALLALLAHGHIEQWWTSGWIEGQAWFVLAAMAGFFTLPTYLPWPKNRIPDCAALVFSLIPSLSMTIWVAVVIFAHKGPQTPVMSGMIASLPQQDPQWWQRIIAAGACQIVQSVGMFVIAGTGFANVMDVVRGRGGGGGGGGRRGAPVDDEEQCHEGWHGDDEGYY